METIHHIKTGGTIGGCVPEYREIEILSDIFQDIVDLDKYLDQSLKISARYTEKTVCHKDSRDITDEDCLLMKKSIESQWESGVRKFMVTHGTYTMPETMQYLEDHLEEKVKESSQILLTGSMYPWAVLGSDAPLNLGATLGILLNTDTPRIAMCMHAKLFLPGQVEKDTKNLIFKAV